MKYWEVQKNSIFHSVKLNKNTKKLFIDFLFHRFRILFADSDNYLLPNKWTFIENTLRLEYTESPKLFKNIEVEDSFSWDLSDFLASIETFIKARNKNVHGFFQFIPKEGKWIPPIYYFIPFSNSNSKDILDLQNDLKNCQKWVHWILKQFNHELKDNTRRLLNKIEGYLLKSELEEILEVINHESRKENVSFLDIITESEFFSKIRETYEYRKMSRSENIIDSKVRKGEFFLEINIKYKDPHFGVVNRPSIQEVWDSLMDNSRTTRILAISDLKNPINPTIKQNEKISFVEWLDVHPDQQIIKAKVINGYLPKRGFLYVFEYGDIDQFSKKRKFIHFAKNQSIITKCLYSPFKKQNGEFRNKYQRDELPYKIVQNAGLFAVQGPPGTGKTYLATEVIKELLHQNPYAKVLICSKEHLSLNHILLEVTKQLKKNNINFRAYRSLSRYRTSRAEHDQNISSYLGQAVMREIGNLGWDSTARLWYQAQENLVQEYDLRNLSLAISSANLVFCTTMDSIFFQLISKFSFDLVVIEEAGKCYPSEIIHTFCLGQNILLIGDHNQLPPYQIKETEEAIKIWETILTKMKNNKKLEYQLLDRFGKSIQNIKSYFDDYGRLGNERIRWIKPFETIFQLLSEDKKYILDDQYRMEPQLSKIISTVFYKRPFKSKKTKSNPLISIIPKKYNSPLLWIDVPHIIDFAEATEDPEKIGVRENHFELLVLIKYLSLIKADNHIIDFVILTPYNAQKDLFLESFELKQICSNLTTKNLNDLVKTVDEYQGKQAALTIVSLVRNNTLSSSSAWGFLTETERLNVMFSRAEFHQVIIGCSKHITRNQEESKVTILSHFLREYKKYATFIEAQEFLKEEELN